MQNGQGCFGIPKRQSAGTSLVQLWTANGYGSTAAAVSRFTNSLVSGDALTYYDSSVNGASVVVNKPGLYLITGSVANQSAATIINGITVNEVLASTGSTNIANVTYAQGKRASGSGNTSGGPAFCSVPLILTVGDVIRNHTDSNTLASSDAGIFTVALIASL